MRDWHATWRYHARTLCESCWPCPICGRALGGNCDAPKAHDERAKRARMAWWGCTEDELPERIARAVELKRMRE